MFSCAQQEQRARVPELLQSEDLGNSPWQRDAVDALLATELPESLRKLGAQSGKQTVFRQGERSVPVRVYELGSGTAAFEAVQTYPRAVNEYYFQMGASFVVVDAAALRSEERRPFLLAFQAAAMPGASSPKEN
ncbi:MAG: hypothetical protein KIT83_18000 [Bryobacterales bacterium]|nr:hypothetical protein [Bryobacterales bacterium]